MGLLIKKRELFQILVKEITVFLAVKHEKMLNFFFFPPLINIDPVWPSTKNVFKDFLFLIVAPVVQEHSCENLH